MFWLRNKKIIFKYAFLTGGYLSLLGANACSHTKWSTKLDFPVPEWPIAHFPDLKYPLEEHTAENRAEENKCLNEVSIQ